MIFKPLNRSHLPLVVILAISLSVMPACGKDSPTQPAQQVPARITLSATSISLNAIGETAVMTATVLDQDNDVIQGADVTWKSSDTNVATVSGNGQITAVDNGSAQITATAGAASASANVTVSQSANSVTVTPASVTLTAVGATAQLDATVYDSGNKPIPDAEITWSSNDPAVATVSASGLVTAVTNGTARISASSGNNSASATITVMQTAGRITILPGAVANGSTRITATSGDLSGTVQVRGRARPRRRPYCESYQDLWRMTGKAWSPCTTPWTEPTGQIKRTG